MKNLTNSWGFPARLNDAVGQAGNASPSASKNSPLIRGVDLIIEDYLRRGVLE